MNLADLLNILAKTAGIPDDNEEFKALVQTKALAKMDVPEDLGKSFTESLEGGLLSIEAAKNNKEIKDHFTALALNGVDTELEKVIADMDLDEETKTLLANTDSTYKKVSLIPSRLKIKYDALIVEAKKGGKSDEDVENLNTEIGKLNEELKGLKENTIGKDVHENLVSDHAKQILDLNIKTRLAGRKLTTTLPRNVAISAAHQVLLEELKAKGIVLSPEMTLKQADGTQDYYDKHNQLVKFDDFIDNLLTENKLLDVSPTDKPIPPGPIDGPKPPLVDATAFDEQAAEVEDLMKPKT